MLSIVPLPLTVRRPASVALLLVLLVVAVADRHWQRVAQHEARVRLEVAVVVLQPRLLREARALVERDTVRVARVHVQADALARRGVVALPPQQLCLRHHLLDELSADALAPAARLDRERAHVHRTVQRLVLGDDCAAHRALIRSVLTITLQLDRGCRRPRQLLGVAHRALVAELGRLHGQHAEVELAHLLDELRCRVCEAAQLHHHRCRRFAVVALGAARARFHANRALLCSPVALVLLAMAFHGDGRAVLCFPRDGGWFQGYVFLQDPEVEIQLGILAEELPIDDCVRCPDGGYREYRLTLMHFDVDKEAAVVVAKTGGDFCQLRSDQLHFESTMLMSDQQAADAIRTYFPTIAARAEGDESILADCLVCFGDIKITGVDFQSKASEP